MATPLIIRDSVHKTIRLTPAFQKLLSQRPMQRLRYISQLGFANLLYPGANGTRLDHAIGTYQLAGEVWERLQHLSRAPPIVGDFIELENDDGLLLQAAALLHDIGHPPFSHVIDEFPWYDHEKMGVELIRKGPLKEVLDADFGGAGETVCNIIAPEKNANDKEFLLHDVLSGPLSIDMLDYLQRDALYTGVPYGEIDADRLFETLELDPQGRPRLIINDKGILPVESIFFSRYQMQASVYLHHLLRVAQRMFQEAISYLQDTQPLTTMDYASLTDAQLLTLIRQILPDNHRIHFIEALFERRLYKRLGVIPWSRLEALGKTPSQITKYIEKHRDPRIRRGKERALYEVLEKSKLFSPQEHMNPVLLDVPPMVAKSVSALDVRIRGRKSDLVPMRDLSISAIGPYIERAYQLVWKMRLFGGPSLTRQQSDAAVEAWNHLYPDEAF